MGAEERAHTRVAAYLILETSAEFLLLKRAKTGYADGKFSLVAGHVEAGEKVTQALVREAKEEVGITILEEDLVFDRLLHRRSEDGLVYMDFFFSCARWEGGPQNCEPEKCSELGWFPRSDLPAELLEHVALVLSRREASSFAEIGW